MRRMIAQAANWVVSADPYPLTVYFQPREGGGEIPFCAGWMYHDVARRLQGATDADVGRHVNRRVAAPGPAGSGA